ncbi:hypothetical protein VNI00_013385 [Paramarasmius palmivorus]|uniref:Uncharacterized protein n=1 Tax=Paramarasmius palmivorus TaxID=297713 RepID=A0AAW0C3E8_9AGAR
MASIDMLLPVLRGLLDHTWTDNETFALDRLDDPQNDVVNKIIGDYQVSVRNALAVRAPPTMSVVCPRCNFQVTLPPPEERWYCVSAGLRVGWVKNWDIVKNLVLHVSSNKYASYSSKEDARKAFIAALVSDNVQIVGSVDKAVEYDPIAESEGYLFP